MLQEAELASLFDGRLLTRHEVEMALKSVKNADEVESVLASLAQLPTVVKVPDTIDIASIQLRRDLVERSCQSFVDGTPYYYVCHRCKSFELAQNIDNDNAVFKRIPYRQQFDCGGEVYCTSCINLGRLLEGDYLYTWHNTAIGARHQSDCESDQPSLLSWNGTLSDQQQLASTALVRSLTTSKPHLVYAVTGAGKTEMMFNVMETVLRRNGRVAIASPRIDVCLELFPRIQAAFQSVSCQLLYGGAQEKYRMARITVCTTHQLLRFDQAFDLIIVDEVDAFPYVNSDQLHFAVQNAVKKQGNSIYLTATPDAQLTAQCENHRIDVSILPARFHGYPLVEPTYKWIGNWQQQIARQNRYSVLFWRLAQFMYTEGTKLIFMPNIALAETLYRWLHHAFPDIKGACVHSKDAQRKEKVTALRQRTLEYLVTTTILERGVTFENCHVFIIGSEHSSYSASALVQMSGRVGRKATFPTGILWFGHYGVTEAMNEAKRQISNMNQLAQKRGLLNEK